MFASAPPRRSSVAWLEPGRGRRRRRNDIPWRGILVVLGILVVAGAVAYYFISKDRAADRQRDAAKSFTQAWVKGDERAMWATLDAKTQRAYRWAKFRRLYRNADQAATVRTVRVGKRSGPSDGSVTVPVAVVTHDFGTLRGVIKLPVHDEDHGAKVAWLPHLRLPGLHQGEQVSRKILAAP